MFEYFASHYMTEALNLYILPGKLKPDSLHQQQKSLVNTIKYHWNQNRLDSMTITHTCQDDVHKGTMKVNWKIDSTKVGKLMKYDWIFPDKTDPLLLHQERHHPRSQRLAPQTLDYHSGSCQCEQVLQEEQSEKSIG
jgi:hypothetical protein